MKTIVIMLLSLSGFTSCTNPASTAEYSEAHNQKIAVADSTETVALQYLFNKIKALPKASLKGTIILIGDASIQVKVKVEGEVQQEGKWIYAANITTFYKANKETSISIGSIGIGNTKQEAIAVCIQEWFASFGVPFTNMLTHSESINFSDFKVFAGLMGIRGILPEKKWLAGDDNTNKNIITQIQPQIISKTGSIIPIDIKLMIGENGITSGECRIDNQVSNELLKLLKQLSWPPSKEGYIFKQFYLVTRTDQ